MLASRKNQTLNSDKDVQYALEASRLLLSFTEAADGQAELHFHTRDNQDNVVLLPLPAVRLLSEALREMGRGNAVSIQPAPRELTTQQAADMLCVSRPYLIKLLERGEIPFRKVGKFRRMLYQDVLNYGEADDTRRQQNMRELIAETERLGVYP